VTGALIAWLVAGAGMLMLAFVFQTLAVRKPNLDAGVYAYAKAGFGEYLGFFSAFGYWASACVGNVTYWVLIMATVGAIAPELGDGDTLLAIALSSIGVWVYFYFIQRGVQGAAVINRIVTVAKIVPILVFIFLVLFALDPQVFADNLGGGSDVGSLFDQVRGTMLVTVFVFLGVEGASVYSRHAKRREDVGRATILGFLSVFAIFASVTIVSYGVLPYSEIAELRQPSMAGVLESVVGEWGKAFVSVGLIVSVLGAYLAWTLMAAEVLFVAAKDDDMPRFLARTSGADVPFAALLLSTILVQVMLVVTLFSEDAFNFALDLTSALTLIPFLLAAAYALKLALTRETYTEQPEGRTRELVVGALATIYTAFLLFAAGPKFILVSFIIYAPATILFVMARREQGRQLFSPVELIILAVSVVGAIVGVVALATGWISI
jgi:arginine:ornithine antiporter / lysine permease